jgi:hypothetical protein
MSWVLDRSVPLGDVADGAAPFQHWYCEPDLLIGFAPRPFRDIDEPHDVLDCLAQAGSGIDLFIRVCACFAPNVTVI